MKARILVLIACTLLVAAVAVAHEGPHILGLVTEVTEDSVSVELRDKSVATVAILAATKFSKANVAATFADVKVGDRIAISGREVDGEVVADSIRFISVKPS